MPAMINAQSATLDATMNNAATRRGSRGGSSSEAGSSRSRGCI